MSAAIRPASWPAPRLRATARSCTCTPGWTGWDGRSTASSAAIFTAIRTTTSRCCRSSRTRWRPTRAQNSPNTQTPRAGLYSICSMIKKFIRKILGVKDQRDPTEPVILGPEQHGIDPKLVSANAVRVTQTLQEAGFKAFVVGGAVRDLLLGVKPKDFDIATDATPEEVKPLFRRAFIIGRRFRLVHVHAGAETIEVSTYRAAQTGDDATDEHGRLLSDNVYGSQIEDATRRDLTINALYFDPLKEEVVHFVGGLAGSRARGPKL